MFYCRSFIVSGLIFKSLIYFGFNFVYDVRWYSSFILLHVAVQLSQQHLLKRLPFLHCIFLPLLSEIRCPQVCGFNLWAFYLVLLVHISVFVPWGIFLFIYCLDDCSFVVQSKVRKKNQRGII